MDKIATLWKAPEVNPVNKKARSIPILNPINVYGRVFHFAWFGFFIAFWSWFAFPPLLNAVIAAKIGATTNDVFDSNIVGLVATLLVRLVAGPCCDKFGARKTFAGLLLIGAVPSFCAGGIENPAGLMAVRFFVGILGGTFVPCQVWTTGFFDKNVVGAANALTAGWGNAGGGITYFVMPAIFTSLVGDGLSEDTAWRVAFVMPSIIITATAIAMLLLCPDSPTGKWDDRFKVVEDNLQKHNIVPIPGEISAFKETSPRDSSPSNSSEKDMRKKEPDGFESNEAQMTSDQMLEIAKGEVVVQPTITEVTKLLISPPVWTLTFCYFCSFGGELAINGVLGTYYLGKFPDLGLQGSGNWASMFGLLNFVFRPLGGLVSDYAYKATNHNLWAKKALIHFYGLVQGAFLIAIGVLDTSNRSTLFGLIAGMAFFLEGSNGMNFSLLPHVHPYANGVVSGLTGGMGNLGGVVFACVYRAEATNLSKGFWIIGVIHMAINLALCWIPPVPGNQIGGR